MAIERIDCRRMQTIADGFSAIDRWPKALSRKGFNRLQTIADTNMYKKAF